MEILSYNFLIYSLIVSILCSLSSALIGSWIVIKRRVLVSGGITHASFGGIGLGYFLGTNPIFGSILFAIASAIGIEFVTRKKKLREDSAIGLFWSVGMALGILFIYLTPGYAPDLMGYLFGNILTVNITDIIISSALAVILTLFFIINHHRILYVAFDENYAEIQHVNVIRHNVTMMILTALTIVVNIKVSGIIMVISMLCIGQSAANIITSKYKTIIVLSFLFNVLACGAGLLISWFLNIPSGATIILVLSSIYFVTRLVKR